VTRGALVPVVPGPARADPIGGVIVIPGTGTDLTAMRLRTSAGCPAQATAFYAKIRGLGFPPDGLTRKLLWWPGNSPHSAAMSAVGTSGGWF
jgi:hypothetical protein